MRESVGYIVISKNKDYMELAKKLDLIGLQVFNSDNCRVLKFDRMNIENLEGNLPVSEFYYRTGDSIYYLRNSGLIQVISKSAFVGNAVIKNNDGTTRKESYDCYKFERQLDILTGEEEGKAKAVKEFADKLVDIEPKTMDVF